jgi:hypothetical protein
MGGRILAVRDGQYKLVIDFHKREELLFDLGNDPGELAPLSSIASNRVRAKLLARAREHLAESSQLRDGDLYVQARLRNVKLELGNSQMKVAV